ncbi:MAG TPA: hypothetical protein VJ732_06215 [Bryobacteraceae bacterium]|nr:hypothetical protein [Bryobacteraceae bacterium]
MPGVQRNFGNIVFPGGEGPAARVNGHGRGRSPAGTGVLVPYAYPVYVGSGVNDSYVGAPEAAAPPPPQQPNVVVVYAPPQQTANPVIINVNPKTGEATVEPAPQAYMAPMPQPAPVQQYTAPEEETPNYLIALKDHTIYSALAYWVDKDTLHYFTAGNVHNQVSLSLVDRPLTDRLNKESGHEVKLPAQAQ